MIGVGVTRGRTELLRLGAGIELETTTLTGVGVGSTPFWLKAIEAKEKTRTAALKDFVLIIVIDPEIYY